MTVCIVSHSYVKNVFVAVADEMLSLSDMSADSFAVKNFSIGNGWMCLFSADDLSPVIAIKTDIRDQVSGAIKLGEIVNAFQAAFRKELVAKAESSILAPFGMTMADFRQDGLANFGPEIFSRMFYQIEQLSLNVTFLVYGFDNQKPHIFTIQNRGEIAHFDQPGFWAIGSGQTSALGSLFSIVGHPISVRRPEDVLFLLCRAKFAAESAPGVGENTMAVILKSNGNRSVLFHEELKKIKEIWVANKPVDIPVGTSQSVKSLIAGARKVRDRRPRQPRATKKREA